MAVAVLELFNWPNINLFFAQRTLQHWCTPCTEHYIAVCTDQCHAANTVHTPVAQCTVHYIPLCTDQWHSAQINGTVHSAYLGPPRSTLWSLVSTLPYIPLHHHVIINRFIVIIFIIIFIMIIFFFMTMIEGKQGNNCSCSSLSLLSSSSSSSSSSS